jgi:hypothetical protein
VLLLVSSRRPKYFKRCRQLITLRIFVTSPVLMSNYCQQARTSPWFRQNSAVTQQNLQNTRKKWRKENQEEWSVPSGCSNRGWNLRASWGRFELIQSRNVFHFPCACKIICVFIHFCSPRHEHLGVHAAWPSVHTCLLRHTSVFAKFCCIQSLVYFRDS